MNMKYRMNTLRNGFAGGVGRSIFRKILTYLALLFIAFWGGGGWAQAGEGFAITGFYNGGLIGKNTGQTGLTRCPTGSFVRGVRHYDRANVGWAPGYGMTTRVDLLCSRVTTDGTTVSMGSSFWVNGYAYDEVQAIRTAVCPTGMIARGFYGRDRKTNTDALSSQVGILCTRLDLKAGQWIHFNVASNSGRLDAGLIEGNAPHTSRGPFCWGNADIAFAAYAAQRGGEGYDGVRPYCGRFGQARLSAAMVFSDFAWDQTVGGVGWSTALAQGGTVLPNGAAADAYALPGDNDPLLFQSAHELYVTPASNYGARIQQRPAGINADTYVEAGSCAGGNAFALADEQDGTCELVINGLPDIGVTATAPAGPFSDYGVTQTFTMTATNYGPGATDGDDGFTLIATLPAGWTTSGALPTGCVQGGSTVTCSLDATPLMASSGPGASGGTVSFDVPVVVEEPTEAGDYTVPVVLGRSAPDGDADATNNDFDTGNDSTDIVLRFPPTPSFTVLKTSVLNGNGTISYTFRVENTGNATLTNIVLSDDHAAVTGSPIATLAPGPANAVTLTGTYTVTQADIDAGHVDNLASATGKDPDNADVTVQSHPTGGTAGTPTRTHIPQTASSDFIKSVTHVDTDNDGLLDAGERLNYAFSVENTGNVTLSNVTVTDPRATISGSPIASLAPGVTDATTITGYYDVTQADIDSGSVDNVASMSAEDPNGDPVELDSRPPGGTAGDSTSFTATASTGLSVLKASVLNGDGTITYSFTVENTGNVTLTDVALTDDHATVTGSPIATLLPGPANAVTLTGTHTPTQAEIDAGYVDNLASATGKDPGDADVTVQSHPTGGTAGTPTRTDIPQTASSDFIKTVTHDDTDGDGFLDAGERLNYTFSIENTGNVTLSNVTVTDTRATLTGGPIASLAPGVTDATTITGYYDVTQADIESGSVDNLASMSAEDPDGDPVNQDSRPPGGSPGDSTSFTVAFDGALDVLKTSVLNGDGTISYTFTITNPGNVTLTNVVLSDDHAAVTGSPIATLAPGPTNAVTLTGTYTVSQADIDAGHVDNLASATGKDPVNADVTVQSHPTGGAAGTPTRTDIPQTASSDFIKTVTHDDTDGDGLLDADERLNYAFSVENTGNVTLSNVTVTDPRATLTGGPIATLAPGVTDATTITGYYDVTQADIDSGSVDNVASMSAEDPNGDPIHQDSRPPGGSPGDSTSFTADAEGAIDMIKEAVLSDTNENGFPDKGEFIEFRFTVTNTGNVTLTDISIEDEKADISGSPIAGPLAPGDADTSVTGLYRITQADIDAGVFENIASATGMEPQGDTVTVESRPATGQPGEKTTFTFALNPSIELDLHDEWVDSNSNGFPDPNEPVNYTFTVRNTGNVTVENIALASFDVAVNSSPSASEAPQPQVQVAVPSGALASLAPGADDNTTFTASYLLTQADIDAGGVIAKAKAQGLAVGGTPVSDHSDDPLDIADTDIEGDGEADDPTATPLLQNVVLTVDKTGAYEADDQGLAEPGDTILYTFTVTNDSNVSLEDVVPVDAGPRFNGHPGGGSMSPFSPSSVDLAAGESAGFTARYALTQGDINAAQGIEDGVKNSASATGTGPRGQTAKAPEVEALVELPGFAISKMASLSEVNRGGRVPYTIRAKLLGLPGSTTVNIVDLMPPGLSFVPGSARLGGAVITPVAVGQQLTFENVTLAKDSAVEITLDLAVAAAAKTGKHVNRAWVSSLDGRQLSGVATAVVEVMADPLFDCGDIIGKVFDDKNRNGYQDDGERGLAGVRVATVKGLLVTADAEGRFHIACADLPDRRIGSNYILKLDTRSLPSGYRLTTENPRVVRLTAGKASKFLFGASVGRVVRLDLSDAAFDEGVVALRPEWQAGLARMVELLDKEPSVLRLVYTENGEGRRLAQKRLKVMRKDIAREWRRVGARYRLEVEAKVLSGSR